MSNDEIIRDFINTGRAIYMAALIETESEGLEVPNSITIEATTFNDKIIQITIAVKEDDTDENI